MLRVHELGEVPLRALLARFGLRLTRVAPGAAIPGSYWGAPEAGLRRARIYLRADTPVHSVLHESAHFVCMDPRRRSQLDTDAGGDELEETAVCYLQVLLSDQLVGFGRARMFADMDAWGYSFRLGSALRWFAADAGDAQRWLRRAGVVDGRDRLTWRRRGHAGCCAGGTATMRAASRLEAGRV